MSLHCFLYKSIKGKITMNTSMKIAAVTDDGITICSHFGRAQFYEVLSIENGTITKRERRPKAGHHTFAHGDHDHSQAHGASHGFDAASVNKHNQMAETIKDCQVVLARGMGNGAYQGMLQNNIKPIVTDIQTIDEAVQAVINGTIVDHTEKLH
jgi:predicted Fe-Mo cluster-binding NifX family protein